MSKTLEKGHGVEESVQNHCLQNKIDLPALSVTMFYKYLGVDLGASGNRVTCINKTRRMLLKLYSKKKLHKCRNCRKSTVKEYRSGASCTTGKSLSLNCEAQSRCCQLSSCEKQVYAKDWLRALNSDLERLGIIRKDEWMKKMKPLKYNEVDQSTQRMVSSRTQILPCEAGTCSINFVERKKC